MPEITKAGLTYNTDSGIFTKNGEQVGYLDKKYNRLSIYFEGELWKAHRLAWFFVTGTLPDLIDHIDRNSLNNSFQNLRVASKAQNAWNSEFRAGKSVVKGVTFDSKNLSFRVEIGANGKRYRKRFPDLASATAYANKLREELHGEFAHAGTQNS